MKILKLVYNFSIWGHKGLEWLKWDGFIGQNKVLGLNFRAQSTDMFFVIALLIIFMGLSSGESHVFTMSMICRIALIIWQVHW